MASVFQWFAYPQRTRGTIADVETGLAGYVSSRACPGLAVTWKIFIGYTTIVKTINRIFAILYSESTAGGGCTLTQQVALCIYIPYRHAAAVCTSATYNAVESCCGHLPYQLQMTTFFHIHADCLNSRISTPNFSISDGLTADLKTTDLVYDSLGNIIRLDIAIFV
jgi:hypothetical protein